MRSLISSLALLSSCGMLCGCAVLSADPALRVAVTMRSPPPPPKDDSAPRVVSDRAWVPGYYEPAFGAWTWHPGRAVDAKAGYRIVEASYIEKDGRYSVRLPHWERTPVAGR